MNENLPKLLERLQDYDGYMYDTYGRELIEEFEESKGLKRALLTRRYPEVADYIRYRQAQQSIADARRSAFQNEGNHIVW